MKSYQDLQFRIIPCWLLILLAWLLVECLNWGFHLSFVYNAMVFVCFFCFYSPVVYFFIFLCFVLFFVFRFSFFFFFSSKTVRKLFIFSVQTFFTESFYRYIRWLTHLLQTWTRSLEATNFAFTQPKVKNLQNMSYFINDHFKTISINLSSAENAVGGRTVFFNKSSKNFNVLDS